MTNLSKQKEKERNYFRVEYPQDARPNFTTKRNSYQIINLSEGGMLFGYSAERRDAIDPKQVKVGLRVRGTIEFRDAPFPIIGEIRRVHNDLIAVEFIDGPSFQRIMSEQRFLIGKYGTLRRPIDREDSED